MPEDTDLNHYFEIMNSRGEQLEKHEVLKARLMKPLSQEKAAAFAEIWDACADMSRYVQLRFSANKIGNDSEKISERVVVFGEDWNKCTQDFDSLVSKISDGTGGTEGKTLTTILKNPKFKDKKDEVTEEGKYGSVINFPNFLLQVLLVLYPDNVIPLDDKKLLDSFKKHPKYIENKVTFAKDFIMALLRMRLLLDNWVIKTSFEADNWSLKTIKPSTEKSGYSSNNSAADNLNKQLVMVLSMFHVSFPTQNYKHWLSAALKYLYKESGGGKDGNVAIDGSKYLEFLECLSDKFFYGRFGVEKPVEYHELVFTSPDLSNCSIDADKELHQGTRVKDFIFNRLDYLLWKKIDVKKEKQSLTIGNNEKINIENLAKNFKFTFRTSVEHHYAQNLYAQKPLNGISCDNFGNLCLISHQSNSRLSDRTPHDKSFNPTGNESLKQAIMMSHDSSWEPGHEAIIKKHEDEMIALLTRKD